MRRVISFILLASVAVSINGTLVSLMLFEMNRAHIAASCCEQRTPDCRGSCYLRKSLDKSDASQDSTIPKIVFAETSFDAIIISENFSALTSALTLPPSAFRQNRRDGFPSLVAQPPRTV